MSLDGFHYNLEENFCIFNGTFIGTLWKIFQILEPKTTHSPTAPPPPLKLMSVVEALRPCVAVACTGSVVWWSERDERDIAPHFEMIGPSPNGMMGSSSFTRLYGSETCSHCLGVHSLS